MASIQTRETERVVALLGGRAVFKHKISKPLELQEATRQGFPYAALEVFMTPFALPPVHVALLLGIAARTLARRKQQGVLSPPESDRLLRVAIATSHAEAVFGTADKAREWLHRENKALGSASPISVLDTEIGKHQVEELLNRINHGLFS